LRSRGPRRPQRGTFCGRTAFTAFGLRQFVLQAAFESAGIAVAPQPLAFAVLHLTHSCRALRAAVARMARITRGLVTTGPVAEHFRVPVAA